MIYLAMKQIVHLERHLCKEPVIFVVEWRINEVLANIGPDSEG